MKHFLLSLAVLGFFLHSCSTNEDGIGPDVSTSLRLQTLDLSGAKYLSLSGVSNRSLSDGVVSEIGLFKIDEQGNISTVVLSCVEEEDGTVTQVRNDIKVVPAYIASLSGKYTLLWGCDFCTDSGEMFDMRAYYEPNKVGEPFNILVRNSDGKIFYIPQSANKYFPGTDRYCSVLGANGALYILAGVQDPSSSLSTQVVITIALQGDDLVIKQVSPEGLNIEATDIWVLDNNTIVTSYPDIHDGMYTFLYPNGGFETINLANVYLTKVSSGVKGIQIKEYPGEPRNEYIVSLHDYTIGTSVGRNKLSEPLAAISSGTDYSTDLGDVNYVDWVSKVSLGGSMWVTPLYETSNSYLLGSCLVVDKQTKDIRGLSWDESNHVIIPTESNVYKGCAWHVYDQGAEWFNAETLEYGEVLFDFSAVGPFVSTDTYINIPAGEVTITGVRNSDGKRIFCFVNIESGAVQYSVSDDNLPIITLVPLN